MAQETIRKALPAGGSHLSAVGHLADSGFLGPLLTLAAAGPCGKRAHININIGTENPSKISLNPKAAQTGRPKPSRPCLLTAPLAAIGVAFVEMHFQMSQKSR